jgi:hypothetical protein
LIGSALTAAADSATARIIDTRLAPIAILLSPNFIDAS